MTEMAPEPTPQARREQIVLRRGLIADLIREIAHQSDVGPASRQALVKLSKVMRETPGVDGTCRSCGDDLSTQYRGRPREFCSARCRQAQWRRSVTKSVTKTE